MKLILLPQVPQPAIVHNLKDYFSLPQLIDYANAVAEAKELQGQLAKVREATIEECARVVENGHFLHDQAPTKLFSIECAAAIRRTK